MSQARREKRKLEKDKKKELDRKNRAKGKGSPSTELTTSNIKIGHKSILSIEKSGNTQQVRVDLSKLSPPSRKYNADCFAFEKYDGYSELFFGNKRPGKRDSELLHSFIIRFPNRVVKDLMIDGHKDFYEKLFENHPFRDEHINLFGIDLENQFPIEQGKHLFENANLIYGVHGGDEAELMFFKISPSYLHHLSTGNPTILVPETTGVEDVITIVVPITLLAYIYNRILEKKNEF